jgi:hypothetical protein
MSELPMRGHFLYLCFKTFPMTPRTLQCEVFWALLSSSKHSGVPKDSKSELFQVLGFTLTLGQSRGATEFLDPMSFNPYNHFLNIWDSIGTPIPKVAAHLRVCGFIPSHLPTFLRAWNVTPRFHYEPTPLQPFVWVTSPRLRSWQTW